MPRKYSYIVVNWYFKLIDVSAFYGPPKKLCQGNVLNHVCLSVHGGSYVTITHDALDLTIWGTLPDMFKLVQLGPQCTMSVPLQPRSLLYCWQALGSHPTGIHSCCWMWNHFCATRRKGVVNQLLEILFMISCFKLHTTLATEEFL